MMIPQEMGNSELGGNVQTDVIANVIVVSVNMSRSTTLSRAVTNARLPLFMPL